METKSRVISRTHLRIALCLIAGLMLLSGLALADESETRVSISTGATKAQRQQGLDGAISHNEFATLETSGRRDPNSSSNLLGKPEMAAAQAPNIDFWFYTADVVLFNDHDADGFYHGIDLLFDADTYYDFADVYAVIYLSLEGGPWNEYAATEDFTIFGASGDDEYVIVTELLSGYPSGSYDVLIELFDAFTGEFLAYIGPEDTSELAFLPLEDANRDTPIEVPEVIVVHEHGGGSIGLLFLLIMLATALAGRLRGARCA